METIYNLIKTHSAGKGEEIMWESTAIISEAIEKSMPEQAKSELYEKLYGLMSGGHYDQEMAEQDVKKMYYVDEDGEKHSGPYLTVPVVEEYYEKVKQHIPTYNEWDFYVTLHMVASDNHDLLVKWFPSASQEERIEKYVDLAVNWLNDDDQPSTDRIWSYLH